MLFRSPPRMQNPQNTPLSRNTRKTAQYQNQRYSHDQLQNPPTTYGQGPNSHHRRPNNGHNGQNRRPNNNGGNQNTRTGHWTSTPRDGSNYRSVNFNATNDVTINNSLVTLLDNHRRVQHDTTQALTKIIEMQDTRANDMYVIDLPTFSGNPQQFLNWILKVEKASQLTGRSERELATAKSEGAVYYCLRNIPRTTSWEG